MHTGSIFSRWDSHFELIWYLRKTLNLNVNRRLVGTTMCKISFEGVLVMKRAGLVKTFRTTVHTARLQEKSRASNTIYMYLFSLKHLYYKLQKEGKSVNTCRCLICVGYSFWFYHIHRCVLALYTQYFPESCEKISQACYSGGIRTHDPCNSRAVSYQLGQSWFKYRKAFKKFTSNINTGIK